MTALRLNLLVVVLSLTLLAACGGSSSGPQGEGPGLQRITADWLATQPGVKAGDYSLHLLDADNQPLPWRGLEASAEGSTITIKASGDPPEDAYLYVVYPSERLTFASADLDASRNEDYLILAAPGRTERVLPVAIARVGNARGRALQRGPLMTIRFAPGAERIFRSTSAVSDDPSNAVTLTLGQATGGTVELLWEERNLGDYDNNGVVTVADLSPLGKHIGKPVAGDPELVVIDGDENGQLTVADIGKIGRNLGTQVAGYVVERTPAAEFTVNRADILALTPENERKQRLQYTFAAPFVPATVNQFTVAAIDASGARGPDSNTVSYDAATNNQPPIWDATEGIVTVTPISNGLRITFGSASDPEGGPVEYVLRYNDDPGVPGGDDAIEVIIPAANTTGDPPYTYDIMGLTPGQKYNLRLRAHDEQGLNSTNADYQSGTVPEVGLSADPWSRERGNAAATGTNPTASIPGPIAPGWGVDVYSGDVGYTTYIPVVSGDGTVYVMEPGGDSPYVIGPDGEPLTSPAGVSGSTGSLAIDGNTLISSNNDGLSVFNLALNSGTLAPTNFVPMGDVLLLGNYGIAANNDGLCGVLTPTAIEDWNYSFPQSATLTRPAVSDGTHVWHAGVSNQVVKLDAVTGQQVELRDDLVVSVPGNCPPLLDVANRRLYLLGSDRIMVLDADSFAGVGEFALTGIKTESTLTYIAHATPPILLVSTFDTPSELGTLRALDVTDPANILPLWTSTFTQTKRLRVSASADRIYAGQGRDLIPDTNILRVLEFDGTLVQNLSVGGQIESEPIPIGDRLYMVVEEELRLFTTASNNLPPVWQGISAKPGGGIRQLTEINGDVTVEWDYAADDLGAPVEYAVYWRIGQAPDFEDPGVETTVITGIPDNGTGQHSFTFSPGTDQRVYVGVRAYDAPWDESPMIDPNTNSLGVTPGWATEELVLGTNLPTGELFFLRGDTRSDGLLGLTYNDEASTQLTYLFGNAGAWSYEQSGLASWPAIGFELLEDGTGGTLLGICDNSDAAVLNRDAPDAWSEHPVQGSTQPGLNPQISLMLNGADGALGYTQHMGGAFPDPETHYWSSFLVAGDWEPAISLDDENFSGRDIAMVYAAGAPTAIYQLGTFYAPNRLTPQEGHLRAAIWDGTEWDRYIIDPGVNLDADPEAESDCGKRIRAISDGNLIHIAYLDLNVSPINRRGSLKYALFDPVNLTIDIEELAPLDLTMQTGSMQFTYGEIGLELVNGEPVISYLLRETLGSDTLPHFVAAWTADHRSGDWVLRKLADSALVFPADREPCTLLVDGAGKLHMLYASSTEDLSQAPNADKLVHIYER